MCVRLLCLGHGCPSPLWAWLEVWCPGAPPFFAQLGPGAQGRYGPGQALPPFSNHLGAGAPGSRSQPGAWGATQNW